ncbi:amino acid ABC transporter substrate-binding protein [Roseibium denhamense]|uniref:Amino acid ABC transporter substrate-binding protein, PAAT family n=1 Tax=Roseibium denhamense TaxID=76305 RepID=A0ABY1N7P5_9HYPH|nr:transporter substrate-binding domain-containing protein [Roseibium denhamense]MTI05993.1 amino acid ABC transporter substrate-binding protein [Roseibium denhamense]SMP02294.1 amino acid ABC transporter substrate-binding protein, PAAT family [Roseibium denhamense]
MFRSQVLLALIGAIAFACLPGPAAAQDCPRDGTLIAGAGDYRPYNIVEGNQVSGMDFDVIETILDKMGCGLIKVPLPWTRHLNAMRLGTVDIATPVTKTPERETFAHFSSPYIQADEILFVRAENLEKYENLSDFFLRDKRLGVVRDYAYGGSFPEMANAYPHLIEQTDSLELNLKQLELGRVDAILGETYVVTSVIKQLGLSNVIKPTEIVVASEPNYIMFSKESIPAEFVDAFSKELRAMQENGEFERITAPYKAADSPV